MRKDNLINKLTTFFGFSFYIPFVPGVLGIILGAILICLLNYFSFWFKLILWIFILIFSFILTDKSERLLKRGKDPNVIILDEINAFFFMAIFFDIFKNIYFLGFSLPLIFYIVVLFSFFDAIKFFPANVSEKLKGGWGIVIDDLISALFTIFILKVFLL